MGFFFQLEVQVELVVIVVNAHFLLENLYISIYRFSSRKWALTVADLSGVSPKFFQFHAVFGIIVKQVCIPVRCVPSASVAGRLGGGGMQGLYYGFHSEQLLLILCNIGRGF